MDKAFNINQFTFFGGQFNNLCLLLNTSSRKFITDVLIYAHKYVCNNFYCIIMINGKRLEII